MQTEEVKRAYLEWIVKVCEIFCQSRCDPPSSDPDPKISRHFALSLPEKFTVRQAVLEAETRGFFDSGTKLALSFSDKAGNLFERIVFTFYPVKDLPPQFRDERKSLTLLRRLSVAIRVMFSVSRLLPAFAGDRKFHAVFYASTLEEISDSSRLEIFTLGSHLGILKVLVEYRQPREISDSPSTIVAPVVQIDEEYVRGKVMVEISSSPVRSSEIVVSSVPAALPVPLLVGNSFVFARSEGSSPGSASRDLLLDVWPAMTGAPRKSSGGSHPGAAMLALGGPESLSSEDGNFFQETSEAVSSSPAESEKDVGNFFFTGENFGENEPSPSLGDLLLFARQVNIRKFREISDLHRRVRELEELDKHLKLLK